MKISQTKKFAVQLFYNLAPFEMQTDKYFTTCSQTENILSILICCSRANDLPNILFDLKQQNLDKNYFEIIILNDGIGDSIDKIINDYQRFLNIIYLKNKLPSRIIGKLRNETILSSKGEYLLFLDDDARIFQKDFLEKAINIFNDPSIDGIMPQAKPSYGIVKNKFEYIDEYSYATRCCLYRRKVVEQAGGFNCNLRSYEDIELSIRLTILGINMISSTDLTYFHPPLYFETMQKPFSIGQSILQIRKHYSLLLWLAVFMNAIRYLPLLIIPVRKYQQWGRISLGVILSPFIKKQYFY